MNNTIYALGFFDGVHLGHQRLLELSRELAREQGCFSGAVTFGAHPDALVLGAAPKLINTPEDRARLLSRWTDTVITLPFDEAMRSTPWEAFLDLLCREYGAVGFVCGDDFRFGDRGAGTAFRLAEYCRAHGLPCAIVPEQSMEGKRVSSTYIRSQLEAGHMETANKFLGHPHILTGTVVSGKQLGRTIGIPTANLLLPPCLAVPRFGVYACRIEVDGKAYSAVTNIGTRPTVAGHGITVESWLLDFSGDLYGRTLTLEFHSFVRPERKFGSLADLQAEIRRNAEYTESYFGRGHR